MVRNAPRCLTAWCLIALSGGGGCLAARPAARPNPVCCGGQGVIYAVDGAGSFQAMSGSLQQAVAEERLPFCVETFYWSHGYGRFIADQTDRDHAVTRGRQLAGQILGRRQAYPQAPVYLVGHSAGSGVVLAALEVLPPDSVERVVLLAPAVAADYDMRPALRACRKGIDVIYSTRDWFYLGLGTAILGTADGCQGCDAAGRTGFRPILQTPDDCRLYRRLRQHPWHPSLETVGNFGGHYSCYNPGYLRIYVLPLLTAP